MKKFLRVLLVLASVGLVYYIATQKQAETRKLWDEVLAKVPCCPDCGKGPSAE